MNVSQIDPSLAVAFSILFNLSSVPVLAITALSQSKPLITEMGGTLTIPNEEATSTLLVMLPLETVVELWWNLRWNYSLVEMRHTFYTTSLDEFFPSIQCVFFDIVEEDNLMSSTWLAEM